MKKIIPLLGFAFFSTLAIGQITIEPEFVEFFRDNIDLSNNNLDESEHYTVTNTSMDTIELIWFRDIDSGCNADWQTQVCDNNLCYLFGVGTNSIQGIPPAILAPGESSDLFTMHVWPRSNAGCCTMQIHYFLKGNLQDTIGTVTFDVRINDPNCELTDTKEEIASALRLFPNPVTSYFQLEGNETSVVKELVIYNLIGRQVRSFNAAHQTQFDMSGLPQGIYLVGMIGNNGEVLKTMRISRQYVTP